MNELDAIKTGDWSSIFKRWNNYILACCDWDSDMAQEVWIKIIMRADKFTYGSFKSWIATIASNTRKDFLKSKFIRRKNIGDLSVDGNFITTYFSDEIDMFPSDKAAKEELEYQLAQIDMAIDKLPPKEKDVLILRKYKSFKEIAVIMDTSIDSALGSMHRARQHIKLLLKDIAA